VNDISSMNSGLVCEHDAGLVYMLLQRRFTNCLAKRTKLAPSAAAQRPTGGSRPKNLALSSWAFRPLESGRKSTSPTGAVRVDEAVCLEQRHLRGGPDAAPGTAREPESTCR
jgi:hypothetical protein